VKTKGEEDLLRPQGADTSPGGVGWRREKKRAGSPFYQKALEVHFFVVDPPLEHEDDEGDA